MDQEGTKSHRRERGSEESVADAKVSGKGMHHEKCLGLLFQAHPSRLRDNSSDV